jgi:hypothetical protein
MTGTITALSDKRVTIGGESFDYAAEIRWFLERCKADGCPVEAFVVGGFIRHVVRVPR